MVNLKETDPNYDSTMQTITMEIADRIKESNTDCKFAVEMIHSVLKSDNSKKVSQIL